MGDDGAFSTTTAPELISDVQHVPLMSNAPNVERFAPVWTHSVHFVLIRENEKKCDAVVIGAPSETPVVWVPRRRARIWSSAAARRCALPRSRARLERVAALRVAMSAPKKLTIVLVGQTGNGKSATGNSLLGRDAFVAKRSLSSVTERCEVHVATLDENDAPILPGDTVAPGASISRATTELRVVDTPGTCDSGALLEDNLRHISAFLRGEADAANDPDGDSNGTRARVDALSDSGGTHALVLVLSAAARFTQEEAVAMERLVARLGEGVLRHAVAVFTRGGEVLRDGGDVHELIASAPPSLRQLLARMGVPREGADQGSGDPRGGFALVENFPNDGQSRRDAAAAPLLATIRALVDGVAAERGVHPNDATYAPETLAAASAAADSNPSTSALAMLDRLKRQLASGPLGGGTTGDPRRDAMAAAAMQAFSDLQAQFAARGGLVSIPPPGTSGGTNAAPLDSSPFGGFFSRASSTDPAANRPETRFAAKETKGVVVSGDGDASLVVSGAGDVGEAFGAFDAGSGSFYARPAAGIELGAAASGRARLAGRIVVRGGSASVASSHPDRAMTLQSPCFLEGPAEYVAAGPIADADWLDEGAYKCALRCRLDPNKPLVYAVSRGAAPGETPDIVARVSAGARFELQGGTLSAQATEIGWECDGGDVVFDGTWDVVPRVEATFRASGGGEGMRVVASENAEWPWRRRVDVT